MRSVKSGACWRFEVAEFGDEMAMPIVGNFDPPVAAIPTVNVVNTQAGDYNGDDTEFESWLAESASDEAEVTGDLSLATAWQVWDQL
jgi:hypothetical protein